MTRVETERVDAFCLLKAQDNGHRDDVMPHHEDFRKLRGMQSNNAHSAFDNLVSAFPGADPAEIRELLRRLSPDEVAEELQSMDSNGSLMLLISCHQVTLWNMLNGVLLNGKRR